MSTAKRLGACTYCGLKATVKPNGTAYCSRCRRFTPRLLDPIPFETEGRPMIEATDGLTWRED